MISKIADLAKEENVVIELKIGPDAALSFIVFDGGNRDFISIWAYLPEEDILDALKDTIRRAKE